MDKIKVLHLIDGGYLGGGQQNIISICRCANKSNFEFFAAAKGNGMFKSEINKINIEFYNINLPKILRTKYLKQLVNLYDELKFDIIHSHGGVAGFYGRIFKKHHPSVKIVHSIHGIHYINSPNVLRKNLSKTVEQYLVQFTDKTICETSNDFKNAVKNKITDKNKTEIIPNGINITEFSNLKKDAELIKKLGFNDDNFIIGNISRFDEQKNQKLIIQAAYFLIRKYPNMKFVLVGSGKYLKYMKELARNSKLEDYIIFTGEQTEIFKYYSIFDVFVLPSFWEGMPYVLLQAMASRMPIVCSHIPNLLEVIKPDYSALTIDPNNMDDLFIKISALYQSKDLRDELAQNAMIEATQYDEKEIIPKIENIYSEVMNK